MNTALKLRAKLGVTAATVATSFVGFAANAGDYTTEIAAAGTEANGNQSAVIGAVIALTVIGFGVTAFLGWLRR